ncbi:lutropin-choriogonadotropic hormone receptor-like isoform X3 [Photinus pyralis]|nr:lutropin-choriogonadotropic hormone receptor-like isoform X3 [Photinus pyralis]
MMNRRDALYWFVIISVEISFTTNSPTIATLEEQQMFISKMESKRAQNLTWTCECYNVTYGMELELECRCHGRGLLEIPTDLDEKLERITLTESEIKVIEKNSFQPYKETLRDVILESLPFLQVIEEGTFMDTPNLRTLYISHAPQMKSLHGVFFGVTARKFRSLRIVGTGLQEIPNLSNLHNDNIVQMIELDRNKIERIPNNAVKINAEQVTFNYNEITVIENYAFNGSHIAALSFKGNERLSEIKQYAFQGLSSIQQLDLSGTSIRSIPVAGLSEIEVLKVENTPTMKTIPSIYELRHLQEAHLTHPFHCCAFKYPAQHDPIGYAQYQETVRAACDRAAPALDTGQFVKFKKRSIRTVGMWSDPFEDIGYGDVKYDTQHHAPNAHIDWNLNDNGRPTDYSHLNPLRGHTIEYVEGVASPLDEDFGTFHQTSAEISENKPFDAFCGNFTDNTRFIKCYPEPNALNPCEDIMGSYWLRISVWFVVILAVMGNMAVIIVVIFSGGEITVQRFLICNLAFADFFMGLYLLFIASMDLHSVGTYFNSAYDWQYANWFLGVGCQIAGFLTMFASQLSVFTLTVVTVERWFAITHAMHLTRRIRIRAASKIMCLGWLYSILIAALPLFGVSNYSSTSICLPMEVNHIVDKAYLITIIVLNTIAFALIVFCYAQIYFSLGYETRHSSTHGEMTIAKKMALLVFTDFACWAPIAFFSLTALAGYPLIGVTRSKILLVFFYPLNSCANPYLYAIMTSQYRRDFFLLLSRCGLCRKTAQQYTLTTSSLHTANNSHPIPLLMIKSNGQAANTKPENADDAFV